MEPFCWSPHENSSNGKTVATAFMDIGNNLKGSATKKLAGATCRGRLPSLKKRVDWENLDATRAIRTELPHSICRWLKASSPTNLDVPVSGVSIISTTPIARIKELQ